MNRTFKTIIALSLIAVLVLATLTGCKKKVRWEQRPEEVTETIEPDEEFIGTLAGGWSGAEACGAALPEEVQAAFDKALEGYDGMTFEPITLLSSQVVAGMNYAILCKGTPVVPNPTPSLKVVIVYSRFDGTAEIISVADFSVADFNTGEIASESIETGVPGGWFVTDIPACELPEEAGEALNKAKENFEGSEIEPLAYLGSQVVAGLNFAYVARLTTVTDDPVSTLNVVIVYRDLSGGATVTTIEPLNIADYRE